MKIKISFKKLLIVAAVFVSAFLAMIFWQVGTMFQMLQTNSGASSGATAPAGALRDEGGLAKIHILHPNGGETIDRGSNYTIQWESLNVETVNIVAVCEKGVSERLHADSMIKNKGEFVWTAKVLDPSSKKCKIRIGGSGKGSADSDESDNSFTLK